MVAVHIQAIGRGSDKVLGPIVVGPWHHQNVDLRQQVEVVFEQLLGQSQRGFSASRFIAMLLTQNQEGGPVILKATRGRQQDQGNVQSLLRLADKFCRDLRVLAGNIAQIVEDFLVAGEIRPFSSEAGCLILNARVRIQQCNGGRLGLHF